MFGINPARAGSPFVAAVACVYGECYVRVHALALFQVYFVSRYFFFVCPFCRFRLDSVRRHCGRHCSHERHDEMEPDLFVLYSFCLAKTHPSAFLGMVGVEKFWHLAFLFLLAGRARRSDSRTLERVNTCLAKKRRRANTFSLMKSNKRTTDPDQVNTEIEKLSEGRSIRVFGRQLPVQRTANIKPHNSNVYGVPRGSSKW